MACKELHADEEHQALDRWIIKTSSIREVTQSWRPRLLLMIKKSIKVAN